MQRRSDFPRNDWLGKRESAQGNAAWFIRVHVWKVCFDDVMWSAQNSTVTGRARNFDSVQYLLVHGTADGETHTHTHSHIKTSRTYTRICAHTHTHTFRYQLICGDHMSSTALWHDKMRCFSCHWEMSFQITSTSSRGRRSPKLSSTTKWISSRW